MANGYVRYGNSIHLDGFQILDFCIENAISLDSLNDRPLGRKVFFTGNDTNIGYLREHVWDGDRWRAAAYLDDIDKITNGEGSLGTRVKALEDMLNVDSAETVVSTWEEIQAFLDNVKEGTDLMTMLDDKVSKSEGGRVRGTFDIASTGYPNIRFFQNDNYWGSLGFNGQDNPAIRYGSASAWYTLLHLGNVGEYALKNYNNQGAVDYNDVFYNGIQYVSGQSNNTPIKYGILMSTSIGDASWQLLGGRINEGLYFRGGDKDNTTWGDWKQIAFMDSNVASAASLSDFYGKRIDSANIETFGDGKVRKIIVTSTTTEGRPPHDGSILHFSWDNNSGHEHQLHIANSSTATTNQRMSWRAQVNGTWGEWKSVAFTDSTVEAANRLANKVSLWGNEFDGTQSLKGAIKIKNNSSLFCRNAEDTEDVSVIMLSNNNRLAFGVGARTSGYITQVFGKAIDFYTGSSGVSMTITDEGRVLIKRQTNNLDAIIGTKGLVHIEGGSTKTALGSAPANGLTIGYDTIGGLAQWIHETNFSGNIQAMNLAGTATAYALNLNPLGGTVNVGDGGLNVAGDVTLGHGSYIKFKDSTGTNNISVLSLNGTYFTVGQGAAGAGCSTFLYGQSITFKTGSSQNTALTINSNGAGVFNNTIIADKYNGQGNIAGAAIVINKSGRRFGIGASSDDITSISLGLVSDEYGTWSTEHIIIESSGLATFNGGALIPTGQKLTIGDANGDHATIEYDSIAKAIKVDGNLYTTGTLASGGKAKEGTGTGSGSANVRDFELPADGKTTYDCDHLLKSKNVIVQVFEKVIQNKIEVWEMIVADVTIVTEDRVTVTFGRPTTRVHKVHIIGGNVS